MPFPISPRAVTVGNAGVPASIEIRNTNADANAAQPNTVCNFGDGAPCPAGDPGITLIPACNQLGVVLRRARAREPGVFRVSDTATGAAGTACAGMVFNVALADPANGQVRFTPQRRRARDAAGAGAFCRIGFTFSVLRTPAVDQNPAAEGVQTAQVTDNTQFAGFLTASARGSSVGLRVDRATPAIATVASPQVERRRAADRHRRRSPGSSARSRARPSTSASTAPTTPTAAASPCSSRSACRSAPTAARSSAPFTPGKGGVYRWRASYSGDANNNPVAGACNAENEAVTVVGPPRITVNTGRTPGPCLVTRFTMQVRVRAAGLTGVRVTLDGKTIKRTSRRASRSASTPSGSPPAAT